VERSSGYFFRCPNLPKPFWEKFKKFSKVCDASTRQVILTMILVAEEHLEEFSETVKRVKREHE